MKKWIAALLLAAFGCTIDSKPSPNQGVKVCAPTAGHEHLPSYELDPEHPDTEFRIGIGTPHVIRFRDQIGGAMVTLRGDSPYWCSPKPDAKES